MFLSIVVALLAATAAPHCSPVWPPPGEVVLSDEDLLMEDPYAGYFRSRYWYFNAVLDDGTLLTVSLFEWRLGMAGGPGLLVLCAEPGQDTYALETRIEPLENAPDRLSYRFDLGLVEGDREGSRIHLRLPDFACDLRLRNLLNPWKPGDGYLRLNRKGDAYTRHSITTPLAEVAGGLEVKGRQREVRGWAYSDRGLLSVPVARMNPEQVSLRALGPAGVEEAWMLTVLDSVTVRAYGSRRVSTLLLARGGEWLMATPDFDFRALEFARQEGAPFAFPHRFRVRARDGGRILEGEFEVGSLFYVNDILMRLPPALRAIAEALIRRPVIYRLRGQFRGFLELADGSRTDLALPGQAEYSIMR